MMTQRYTNYTITKVVLSYFLLSLKQNLRHKYNFASIKPDNSMESILVTGASGFIGSYIVSEGLSKGYETWAGVRGTSSRNYLSDKRIRFAQLTLGSLPQLKQQLLTLKEQMGGRGWDYVIHAAGATKCIDLQEFHRTNTDGTRNLILALQECDMIPKRFVFISSLSIFGAIREKAVKMKDANYAKGPTISEKESIYKPILHTDTPRPNTAYGKSKLAAEEFLHCQDPTRFPYVILRPTGVYGPREKDYFVMARSIASHIDFAVGYNPQEITFIYMQDVVQAVYKSLNSEAAIGKAYFLSDGRIYNSRRFSDLLQKELGNPWVLHIKAPLCILKGICWCGTQWMNITKHLIVLNQDKFNILSQRNWRCDIEPAREDLGYEPQWTLEAGVCETVKWYKKNGWL